MSAPKSVGALVFGVVLSFANLFGCVNRSEPDLIHSVGSVASDRLELTGADALHFVGPEVGVDNLGSQPSYTEVDGAETGAIAAWVNRGAENHLLSFARISADGTLLDRTANLLSTEANFARGHGVSINGNRALIAWVDIHGRLRSVLLYVASGQIISRQVVDEGLSRSELGIGTNGEDFLLAYDNLKFVRINGRTGRVFPEDIPPTNHHSYLDIRYPEIVYLDGHYLALFVRTAPNGVQQLVSVTIEDAGRGSTLVLQGDPTLVAESSDLVMHDVELCSVGATPIVLYRAETAAEGRELRAQLLSSDGRPEGDTLLLADIGTANGHHPTVRCAGLPGKDEFLVTFSDYVSSLPGTQVFVHQYSLSGVRLSEARVSDSSHWSSFSHVVSLGSKMMVVYDGSALYPPKHTRFVAIDAQLRTGIRQVLGGTATEQTSLAVGGSRGRFLAAWKDDSLESSKTSSLEFDVGGAPAELRVRAETRNPIGGFGEDTAILSLEPGYVVVSRAADGLRLDRIAGGTVVSTEMIPLEFSMSGPLAVSSRHPAVTGDIAGVLAFRDEAQSQVFALPIDRDGKAIGFVTRVAEGCSGCIGVPAAALSGSEALVVYRRASALEGWLSRVEDMSGFETPREDIVVGAADLGDAAVVGSDDGFSVYYPADSPDGAVIEAISVLHSRPKLETRSLPWTPIPCGPEASECLLAAASTGFWEFVVWNEPRSESNTIRGAARRIMDDDRYGPLDLSLASTLDDRPAVTALAGSKFVVGHAVAVNDESILKKRAVVRLVDLEPDGDGDGFTFSDGDCDDADDSITVKRRFFKDSDRDGYGDPEIRSEPMCIAPAGFVSAELPPDCNDDDPDVNADGTEVPGNHVDEDCSGDVLCFADDDGDGLGSGSVVLSSDADCSDFGESLDPSDCDDSLLVGAFTGAAVAWYADSDGDGYGDPLANGGTSCIGPLAHVANADDCDDTTSSRRPGAYEGCGDGVDSNCDGYSDRAACHLDACTLPSGLKTRLYHAGTREPDSAFAPAPLPSALRIEGLYAPGSETELRALDNLRLAIDPDTGEANLGGRFEVSVLDSPGGGGGSVGDVWTLSMTLSRTEHCGGSACVPVLSDRVQVNDAVSRWRFYAVNDAKLASYSLANPLNEFTYEHTLTPRDVSHPVQLGPAANGGSLRCGLRFRFSHLFDFGAGEFSGEGELVLDLVGIPGPEALAAVGEGQ